MPPAWAGRPRGKLLAEWVKEVGESERRVVMAGIRAETSPDTKVGRLPTGLSSRDSLHNL
ncbi:hypothetical protein DID96_01520 [Burkholderia sp. Bp8963]|nr:hypothetical protein DID96_01520 [Burkholderia sp. Bp8963]